MWFILVGQEVQTSIYFGRTGFVIRYSCKRMHYKYFISKLYFLAIEVLQFYGLKHFHFLYNVTYKGWKKLFARAVVRPLLGTLFLKNITDVRFEKRKLCG